MSTAPRIISLVTWTLALLSGVYFAALVYATVAGVEPTQALTHAGDTVVAALVAMLINTRTQPGPNDPPTKSEIVNSPANPVPVQTDSAK